MQEYILMHKNTKVAKINIDTYGNIEDIVEIFNQEKMPIGTSTNVDDIRDWWRNNSIPAERDSVRLGLERLGVSHPSQLKLLSYGLSLTNHYWVRQETEAVSWKDINFWDNGFSPEIGNALFNHEPVLKNTLGLSPVTTQNGMLNKRWIEKNGVFYVQKKGTGLLSEEVFNEVLASTLLDAAGINHVPYELYWDNNKITCLSPCITDKNSELVHFTQIINIIPRATYPAESEYQHFCNVLNHFGIKNYEYDMQGRLAIGYILAETDMHYNNLALIQLEDNSFKLSPFYDLGNCLYANQPTNTIDSQDDMIVARPFCNKNSFGYWSRQKEFITTYPNLYKNDLINCILLYIKGVKQFSEYPKERLELLANAIMQRAYNLQQYLLEKKCNIDERFIITTDDLSLTEEYIKQYINDPKNYDIKHN